MPARRLDPVLLGVFHEHIPIAVVIKYAGIEDLKLRLARIAFAAGILVDERDMMMRAIGEARVEIVDEDIEEGCWSVLLALPR